MQQTAPPKVYSLSQVASSIRQALARATANRSWLIRAEILKISPGLGQKTVYVDLVEEANGDQRAKMRGVIWPSNGARILEALGNDASTILAPGSEMVFTARIEFHERYGLSLFIENVDLRHMLGEMERRKQATVSRLQELGAFELNKRLPMPAAPQRIALVGSPGTSGFRDFISKTLLHPSQRRIHVQAFASSVQGTAAPKGLIEALQAAEASAPDLIVLVRGGGSKLDLDCFNDFELCRHISLMGIPVWTGIGHESDLVVADLVAHSYWKTPTDVADSIVRLLEIATSDVFDIASLLQQRVIHWLEAQQRELDRFGSQIEWSSQAIVRSQVNSLRELEMQLGWHAERWLQSKHQEVNTLRQMVERESKQVLLRQRTELNQWLIAPFRRAEQQVQYQKEQLVSMESSLAALHPERTVKRGFAMMSHKGEIIADLTGVKVDEELTIHTRSGIATVTIQSIEPLAKNKKTKN